MKKLYMLLLAFTLVLTACGNNEKKEEVDNKVESQAKETESEEIKDDAKLEFNKDIDMGGYIINFKEIKTAKANEDKDALMFIFSLTNKSKEDYNSESLVGMKGFQNGVETEFLSYSDEIDIETERKDIQPEGKLDNVEKGIIVEDFEKEMEVKIVNLQGQEEKTFKINPKDYKK